MKQQHKFIATKDIKCYKGTNTLMQCADKFQFELNKVVVMPAEYLQLCTRGFHGSFDLFHVHYFYSPRDGARYFEAIIPKGSTVMFNPCDKNRFVTNSIKLVRELTFAEAYKMLNKGNNNLGFGNKGNNNLGFGNIGNNNIGNNNEGNNNIGSYNLGSYNLGSYNLDSYNLGNNNKGNNNNNNNNNKGNLNHF